MFQWSNSAGPSKPGHRLIMMTFKALAVKPTQADSFNVNIEMAAPLLFSPHEH